MHRLLILSARRATIKVIILCTSGLAEASFRSTDRGFLTSEAAFAIVMTSSVPRITPIKFYHHQTADVRFLCLEAVLCEAVFIRLVERKDGFHFKARLLRINQAFTNPRKLICKTSSEGACCVLLLLVLYYLVLSGKPDFDDDYDSAPGL